MNMNLNKLINRMRKSLLKTSSPTHMQVELPECATREVKPDETQMKNSASFPDVYTHARQVFESFEKGKNFETMLEIGGSTSVNVRQKFPELEYFNLDLVDNPSIPTLVGDITKCSDVESESFDLIFSNNTFEHIDRPWLAAEEITRLLKPGGVCYISTVWSWRYHPVPIDYWRFSPDCLTFLFQGLEKIDANFNSYDRRFDSRGFWPNKLDAVPVDKLGGWRENWSVYFIGQKM